MRSSKTAAGSAGEVLTGAKARASKPRQVLIGQSLGFESGTGRFTRQLEPATPEVERLARDAGLDHSLQHPGAQRVVDEPPLLLAANEPRVPQHIEVMRDVDCRNAEHVGELGDCVRPVGEYAEDHQQSRSASGG